MQWRKLDQISQLKVRRFECRTKTMSENNSSYGKERVFPKEWAQDNKQEQHKQHSDNPIMNNTGVAESDEDRIRELVEKHSELSKRPDKHNVKVEARQVMNQRRPMLERKSRSDLSSYRNTKIKILVEGEELSSKDTERKCSSKALNCSLQEPSISEDHIAEVQKQHDKKNLRSLVGWFAKSHGKTYDLKSAEENSEKTSPALLKRSRSFSGRIRDKIRMNFTSSSEKQSPKSDFLQPPNLFYRYNVERNRVNSVGVTQFGFQRRHSDQTDSMLRRPLGGRRDARACPAYYSLERGLRQIANKKPLTRKRSNSFEQEDDFPFWSQISDTNRSRSCSARISVTEQLDTHRDNDGMLETNLCSTEL